MTETAPDPDTRRPARAILLLGAAVGPGGRPSPALVRRTRAAAEVWHAGAARAVVACGGVGRHPPAEAVVMRDLLVAAGLPQTAIHPEPRSTCTAENIAFALPILRDLGLGAVIVVSDGWHLPRAALLARRAGLEVRCAGPLRQEASLKARIKGGAREVPAFLAAWAGLRSPGQRR